VQSVLLFPGQGAYHDDVVGALARDFPQLADVYAEIDEGAAVAGAARVSDVLLAGEPPPVAELLTEAPDTLQLCIYAVSVGLHRLLLGAGAKPSVHAGHSLGEIAALATAGAVSVGGGAEIVAHRCAALRQAGRTGRMVALACDAQRAAQILALVGDSQAAVAAANSPRQSVVSGPEQALEAVSSVARSLRIGVIPLPAPYPFHSPMVAGATADFAGRIAHVVWRPLEVPVYSPILGRYYEDADDLGHLLASHLVRQVRFADAIRQLRASGATTFVDCGSGATLSRLVQESAERVRCVPATVRHDAQQESVAAVAALLSPAAAPAAAPAAGPAAAPDGRLAGPLAPAPAQAGTERAATAASSASATPNRLTSRDQLFDQLRSMYAEALEYPPEVFTEDVALEADLGVDSVKQTELFARTVDRYGLPDLPEGLQLVDFDTMGKVVDLVWSLHQAASAEPVARDGLWSAA
jgi:[acyl-carrier-protein] S-malonyltransferase